MKQITFIFLFVLLLVSTATAQESVKTFNLNEVEVAASRSKIHPDATRIVNIIDKKDIEKIPIQNLDELLDRIAGIDARQRSNGGVQADISIRGGSFDQVLILLNGVNITDPQTGHYNLDIPIELSDINRIEILQGSAARVYGPNAFSGAINIITDGNRKSTVTSKQQAGSYGLVAQSLSGSYASDNFQSFASASYKQSDGYLKNTDYKILNTFWQSKINTKNAGYFQIQLSAQSKQYGANSFYTLKYPDQFENTKTFLSSVEWNLEKPLFTLNTQVYWRSHADKFDLFRYSSTNTPNFHQTDVTGTKITSAYDWTAGKTTLGIDVRNEHIFSNNLGKNMTKPKLVPFEKDSVYYTKEDNRLLITAMLDHTVKLKNWTLSGGVSTTFNKQFGISTNGGIDVAYNFNRQLSLYTALNTALRLPTFTNLYYQTATHISNPSLIPEKSVTVELGGKLTLQHFFANATFFHRSGKNVIDWVKQPSEDKWQCKNLTNIDAIGTDINLEYQFQNILIERVTLSGTYLKLNKTADNFDSEYALDYLKNKIIFGISHKVYKNISVNWSAAWYNRAGTYTLNESLTDYKPFSLVNMRINWKLKKAIIYCDINNLTNQKYVEFGGLQQPGINFITGVQIHI